MVTIRANTKQALAEISTDWVQVMPRSLQTVVQVMPRSLQTVVQVMPRSLQTVVQVMPSNKCILQRG